MKIILDWYLFVNFKLIKSLYVSSSNGMAFIFLQK